MTEDRLGNYYIGDDSDRDIKVFDMEGKSVDIFGGPGPGPGEFVTLRQVFLHGDSLFAFDVGVGKLKIRELPTGKPIGMIEMTTDNPLPPLSVFSADSLLLAARSTRTPVRSDLLELANTSGQIVASFFETPAWLETSLYGRVFASIQADAHQGTAFGALAFTDSIYAFDYSGRLVGEGEIDSEHPVPDIADRSFPSSAEIQGESRRDVMNRLLGMRYLSRVVALPNGLVATQLVEFDPDAAGLLQGGTVVVSAVVDGAIENVFRFETEATLVGRSARGEPLFLRYADDSLDTYEVLHLVLEID